MEKVKAAKIVQIKEMQQKQCPVCYSTALQHRLEPYLSRCSYLFLDIVLILNASFFFVPRFNSQSQEQKFAYKCCVTDCNADNLKTAR